MWQLLDPLGRPITLESLENKVLAVDISIWLNQAVRGCRETSACLPHNAHLQTLFNRICKLLHFRIKPVFVFDGGVPVLKKQTLASRRQRKETAAKRAHGTSQKLLMNYLRQQAVRRKLGKKDEESDATSPVKSIAKAKDPDLFELPPLPEVPHFGEEDQEDSNEEWSTLVQDHLQHNFKDLDSLELDSEEFQSLPVDIRHEILTECKDLRKKNSWAQIDAMPKESNRFSSYQMARLLKRRSLQQHLENVEKEISSLKSGCAMGFDDYTYGETARKIMSEDSAHYIFLKGKKKVNLGTHAKDAVEQKPLGENEEIANQQSTSTADVRPCNEQTKILDAPNNNDDTDDLISSDDEPNTNILEHYQKMMHKATTKLSPAKRLATESKKMLASSSHVKNDTVKDLLERNMDDFFRSETYTSLIKNNEQNGTEIPVDSELLPIMDNSPKNKYEGEQANFSFTEKFDEASEEHQFEERDLRKMIDDPSMEKKEEASEHAETVESENSSDFIEISINPQNNQEDELFPLEVFQNNVETNVQKLFESDDVEENVQKLFESDDVEANVQKLFESDVQAPVAASVSSQLCATNVVTDPYSADVDDEVEDTEDSIALPSSFEVEETAGEMVTVPMGAVSEVELREVAANLQAEETELAKEADKQKRTAALISDQMYADSQELLRLFGIPFVVSPMEAEAQCATLDKLELVHGTITEDSDIWLFGGRNVYKNFFNQKKTVEFFQSSDIKHHFGLDQQKLIALAMLTGSDYTDGIDGIGCVSAMEVLSEFPGDGIESLQVFKEWWEEVQNQVKIPQETKARAKLRHVALHPGFPNEAVFNAYVNPTVDDSQESFTWSLPDLDLLRDFSESNFGWSRSKADGILMPLIKRLAAHESQTRLDKFFSVTMDKTLPRLPSKRLRQAIKRVSSLSTKAVGASDAEDAKRRAIKVFKRRKNADKSARGSAAVQGNKTISRGGQNSDPHSTMKRMMPNAGPCLSEDSSASD